jgi:hypothetical protein
MKRITIKSKLKIAFPVILGLLFLSYGNKTSHPAINKIIVEGFVSRNNKYEFSMVKFQDYVFNLNIGKLKGDFIVESGLFNPSEVSRVGDISVGEQNTTYTERSREITAQEWIEHGGYSADVPEVPASLRHFYDPTRPEGERHLTDQVNSKLFAWAQSFLKNPETNGVDWAIGEQGNFGVLEHIYTWEHGKKYLIAALQQPDIAKRKELMAKAWRSLGETLHMIADNGCPAHVRNDGHPSLPLPIFSYFGNPDPYEEIMAVSSTAGFDGGPIDEDLKESFRTAKKVHEIAHGLAVFTNKNFFTNETISGTDWKGNAVKPIAHPDYVYDSPKLSASAYKNDYYYYRTIAGTEVKMCTDMQFFKGLALYRTDPYIDQACVESQAKVLIPAIKEAGIHTVRLFIPALQVEIINIEEDGRITGKITHKTDEEYPKPVLYNGPVNIKNTRLEIINTFTAFDGKFEGRLGKAGSDIFAEIDFGGVVVRSKSKKADVSAFTLGHKSNKTPDQIGWPSSYALNDPLSRLLTIRSFNFVVSEDGFFETRIPGYTTRNSYNEKKGFNVNNGVFENIGDVKLSGHIEQMRKVDEYIQKGGSGLGTKVGTMTYASSGSFSDKEELYPGSSQTQTNKDYKFTVSAKYDLYVIIDGSKMSAPVAIQARLVEGTERFTGLPAGMSKGVKESITFEINK